jgi:hypothetical protein
MNDDFISSSMETGMRVPAEGGCPDGGKEGVCGAGVWPSTGSIGCPCDGRETYQGARGKSRAASLADGERAVADPRRVAGAAIARMKTLDLVFFTTVATETSGIDGGIARAVTRRLPTVTTFPSKNPNNRHRNKRRGVFFLAHFRAGPKMFRLLQCARIAEQHWVSTEANT